MKRRLFLSTLTLLLMSGRAQPSERSPVIQAMILPVLHKRHKDDPQYGYQDIYNIVSDFRPDSVGIEVRQEDIDAGDDYLIKNYPTEMIHLARTYGEKAFGFDWLGKDLEGRRIPNDWWTKQSRIKKLERSLSQAPFMQAASIKTLSLRVEALANEQTKIASSATAAELADGRYDRVTAEYYIDVRQMLRGTTYEELPRFYAARDAHLVANVAHYIEARRPNRVAIVTGADHHGPMIKGLASLPHVTLIPVPVSPSRGPPPRGRHSWGV